MSRWAKVLFLIVLLDTAATLFGFNLGFCAESNPVMAWYLTAGGPLFLAVAKIGITLLGIVVIELARYGKLVPEPSIGRYYVAAVTAYVLLYAVAVIGVNHL